MTTLRQCLDKQVKNFSYDWIYAGVREWLQQKQKTGDWYSYDTVNELLEELEEKKQQ